ncbi:MAG: alginate lyase family protein [Anaerolineales bacterium]
MKKTFNHNEPHAYSGLNKSSRTYFGYVIWLIIIFSLLLSSFPASGADATSLGFTIAPTFDDVPLNHWAFEYIEILYQNGYVAGCSSNPLLYCPEQTMTRAESAVFVERGIHGAGFLPSDPTELVFADVPLKEWFSKWATGLWQDGYTAGCGADPLVYCPLQEHTIAEGSVFYIRMLHGQNFNPPDPVGIFVDVLIDKWYARWIEAAFAADILLPCEVEPELRACPEDPLTRAMGAYMMVKAKGLTLPPPPPGGSGIWISTEEIMSLPTSGTYWDEVKAAADKLPSENAVGGHGSTHDVYTMAAALVAVRLEDDGRRRIVADEILEAVNNHVENDGNSLSLTRTLAGYIIAADVIDLKSFDPALDAQFRQWLQYVVYELKLDGKTQVEKHYKANNHGTQAAVVRLAASLYLGKMDDFADAAEMLKAWLGDPNTFTGEFNWGSLCWQADPQKPVGINRVGSTMIIAGSVRNVDGVQPDEQRRSGCPGDKWPPPEDVHVWGGMQGIAGQMHILTRHGYDAWNWSDQAALRAVSWQHDQSRGDAPASGDDLFILPMIDCAYGTDFWKGQAVDYGKQVGWTAWTQPAMMGEVCK